MPEDINNIQIITGPYRATRLWNAAVRAFHSGMPLSRHRRGLRVYDNCFSGSEAIAWLHQHLCLNPNFSDSVTRDQTIALLKKFVRCGLLEDVVSGESGWSLQFRERGLYKFGSMSPLKALRTPGRSNCSDLRASTRRARAAHDAFASPSLPDHKVSKTERTSSDTQLSHDCQEEEFPSPDPKSQLNDSDHVSKALNVLGVSKKAYDQFKESDKENFVAQPKIKTSKSKSFKIAPQRPALQTIENRPERNLNAALFNNRKTPANVYVPLSQVRKNFCSHDFASEKTMYDAAEKNEVKMRGKENIENMQSSEATHNAINALNEVSNGPKKPAKLPKAAKRDLQLTTAEVDVEPAPSMRSRGKSFLHRPSASSKYSSLIPKFGEPGKQGNSVYASAKTISPKLLHAVSSNPQSVKMSSVAAKSLNIQPSDFLKKSSKNYMENDTGDMIPCSGMDVENKLVSEMNAERKELDLGQNCSKRQLCVDTGSVVPKKMPKDAPLEVCKFTKMTISPEVEQRAYVQAWLEIMEDLMCGCPLTLPRLLVHGETLCHNQRQVSRRGVVLVPAGHPDDLPSWLLAAMRFLAHWPASSETAEEGCGVPNYPGVEVDVYRMVRDYFTHQPRPIIPAPLASALLEIVTACEFLDISFRDPRNRFTMRRQGNKDVNGCDENAQSRASLWEAETDVPLENGSCLSEGPVSVFATLPRGNRGKAKRSEVVQTLEEQDSVEDLMLNMSIGRVDEPVGNGETADTLNKETGLRFLNASYDLACNHSPSSQNCGAQHVVETLQCSKCDTEALPQFSSKTEASKQCTGHSVSEGYLQNGNLSGAESLGLHKSDLKSPQGPGSRHSSQSPGSIHDGLEELSSTNISHIERFTPRESSAVYVSGEDVRRRKTKRRFFSKTNKKKNESSSDGNVDLRRFSIYESLHCVSDEGTAVKDVYSEEETTRSRNSNGFLESSKRSCCTTRKIDSVEQNTLKVSNFDVQDHFGVRGHSSHSNLALDCQPAADLGPGNFSSLPSGDVVLNPVELDTVHLPPNSCFETAFTSDSPKTRIIPQKSVDTLHLGQLKRRKRLPGASMMKRPKSIAVLPGDSQYGEFVPQSLQRRNLLLGSVSCDNSPLYAAPDHRPQKCSPKATSMSNIQCDDFPQVGREFKAPPPPPRRTFPMTTQESSFSKSHSTGDLNAAQDWLMEGQLQHYGSRGESRVSVDTERSGYSINDGHSSAGPSKGRSLVHRVRDSLRRKKAKIKENARYKRTNLQGNSADSSTQTTPVCSPSQNTSSGALHMRKHGVLRPLMDSIPDVQLARVVSSERGHAVHQQNVETLRRLRSSCSSVGNPGALVHRTQSGGFVNLAMLTPSTDEIVSVSSSRDSALPRSTCSPFAAPDECELSDSHSMASATSRKSNSQLRHASARQMDSSEETLSEETRTHVEMPSLSPFAGWSSVTTTNYCTNLSTHYASNHPLVSNSVPPGTEYEDVFPSHEGKSGSISEVQSSLASTPLPQPLSSRSNSLSSLYTTALTCYDESDPHPFAATYLQGSTPPPSYDSLKRSEGSCERKDSKCWEQENFASGISDRQSRSQALTTPELNNDRQFSTNDNSFSSQACPEVSSTLPASGSAALRELRNSTLKQKGNEALTNSAQNPSPQHAQSCGCPETDTEECSTKKVSQCAGDSTERSSGRREQSLRRSYKWDEGPRVYTSEGINRLQMCVQLLLLLLQPVARRRLHLLLRLLHKMSNNDKLQLSSPLGAESALKEEPSNRDMVLDDLGWCVVRGGDGRWRRLIALLVDCHHCLLAPSARLSQAVQLRISQGSESDQKHQVAEAASARRVDVSTQRHNSCSRGPSHVTCLDLERCEALVDGTKRKTEFRALLPVNVRESASEDVMNGDPNVKSKNTHGKMNLICRRNDEIESSIGEKDHVFNADRSFGRIVEREDALEKSSGDLCMHNDNQDNRASSSRLFKESRNSSTKTCDNCVNVTTRHGVPSNAFNNVDGNPSDCERSISGCRRSNESCNSHVCSAGSQCNRSYNSHCYYEHHNCGRVEDCADNANNFNTLRSVNENVLLAAEDLIRRESERLERASLCSGNEAFGKHRCLERNDFTPVGNNTECFQKCHAGSSACRGSTVPVKTYPNIGCGSPAMPISARRGNGQIAHRNCGLHRRFSDEFQIDLDEGYGEFSSVEKLNSSTCRCKVGSGTLSSVEHVPSSTTAPRLNTGRVLSKSSGLGCGRATSYCVQVDAAEWQRQCSVQSQEQHLLQLLRQIVNDGKLSREAKTTKITQFRGLYPRLYDAHVGEVPEDLRPSSSGGSKKRSGGVVRSMLKLASWSHLTRQRSTARM